MQLLKIMPAMIGAVVCGCERVYAGHFTQDFWRALCPAIYRQDGVFDTFHDPLAPAMTRSRFQELHAALENYGCNDRGPRFAGVSG